MASISLVTDVLFCGFLLCLGLSNAAQAHAASAADEQNYDQPDHRHGGQEVEGKQVNDMEGGLSKGGKTIKSEMLSVGSDNYFITKGQDSKEGRLQIDETTQKTRNINIEPGDRIEAKVSDRTHALTILSDQAIQDRSNTKD